MKDLIKQALPILPAGLINSAIAIVDQQFCKALSDEYLYKHLYLAYIPFIMVSVGRVLGTSVKILASKDEKGRKDIYSEFFSFTNVLALIVLLLCVFVFMAYALITDLEFQFIIYGIMQTLSGAFLIILSAYSFIFIAEKKTKLILSINVITFSVNFCINLLSLYFADNTISFITIGTGSALSVLASVLYQRYLFKQEDIITPSFRPHWKQFYTRGKNIILGEIGFLVVSVFYPIVYALILDFGGEKEYATDFNILYRYYHFLSIPFIALTLVATVYLGKSYSEKNKGEFQKRLIAYKNSMILAGSVFVTFGIFVIYLLDPTVLSFASSFIILELIIGTQYNLDTSLLRLAGRSSTLATINLRAKLIVSLVFAAILVLYKVEVVFMLSFFIPSLFKLLIVRKETNQALVKEFHDSSVLSSLKRSYRTVVFFSIGTAILCVLHFFS